MSLTPAFLDELRARTSLSALIGRTVKITRAGREFKGCCPFHNEKTPSFYVNDEKGFYHCFGCSAHGDAIRWLTDHAGLPFMDAVKELAAAAGMEVPQADPRGAQKAEKAKGLHEVMQAAADWFEAQLSGVGGAAARALLVKRGISDETRRKFNFGYAPDSRGKLRGALKEFGDAMLVEAGLLIKVDGKEPYDRFRGRLIIPIRDARGRVIAFGGRIVGEGEPKYLNSPDTPLFDKGRTLYNLDKASAASRKATRIIAVEGYMDVVALSQAGFEEVVAPLGTALTEQQLERLWQSSEVPLLCFDGDTAGQKAALRAAKRALPLLKPARSLAFVGLPEGLDPDDLVQSHGSSAFETYLNQAQPLVERLWQSEIKGSFNTPEERAGLGSRLRNLAGEIKDDDVRKQYLAVFNRMLWDFFHPERPSKNYTRGQAAKNLTSGPNNRLFAIGQFGINQATFVPALVAGFLRHPRLIAPLAETFGDVEMNSIPLRQVREVMFRYALSDLDPKPENLRLVLKEEALEKEVRHLDRIKLAFSFLLPSTGPQDVDRDLAAVTDRLVVAPRLDDELERLRNKLGQTFDESVFDSIRRVTAFRAKIETSFKDAMLAAHEAY